MTYLTAYTGGSVSGEYSDQVVASACGDTATSSALPVYEYYPFLDSGFTSNFDMGQSQVSNTTFTFTSALSESQIQTFFVNNSSWLAHFYVDTTNTGDGGWYNPSATGNTDTFVSGYTTYCPYVDGSDNPICPASSDSGKRASKLIADAASTYSVNPEVLLATLEKEYGVALKTTQPSDAALNQAMGVGNTDFQAQINDGASTFHARFNDSISTWPYFFPANATEKADPSGTITNSIQYSWNSDSGDPCNATSHDDCAIVALWLANAATYAQYKYTPFVQTTEASTRGGVYSFEYWWYNFATNSWFQ
jgi:hypothetical protein